MTDLSKRRPQIDFCAGYRAHKRGEPREGCSKAWHEGWDAHAELASLRDYNLELQSLDSIQQMAIEKLTAERDAAEAERDALRAEFGQRLCRCHRRADALRAALVKAGEALEPFNKLFLYPDDLGFEHSEDARGDEDWSEDANDMTAESVFIVRGDMRKCRAALTEIRKLTGEKDEG